MTKPLYSLYTTKKKVNADSPQCKKTLFCAIPPVQKDELNEKELTVFNSSS